MTPRGSKNTDYGNIIDPQTQQVRLLARKIDFWRGMATDNMKRALDAERRLAIYEGAIGGSYD